MAKSPLKRSKRTQMEADLARCHEALLKIEQRVLEWRHMFYEAKLDAHAQSEQLRRLVDKLETYDAPKELNKLRAAGTPLH